MKLSINLRLRKYFLLSSVVILTASSFGIVQAQETSAKINTIDQGNYVFFSHLLRLAERDKVKEGRLSIPLAKSFTKEGLLKGLFQRSSEQVKGQPSSSMLEVSVLQELNSNSSPKVSLELGIDISLMKSGKLLKGQLQYLKGAEDVPNIGALKILPPNGSSLGDYLFVQGDLGNDYSMLSIQSPITKKCRQIPAEGRGDPVLLSGLSFDDIFFNIKPESQFSLTSIQSEELLVPESTLVKLSELSEKKFLGRTTEQYTLKEMQIVNLKAISSLYARTSTLAHIDVKNGLPYQVQFLIEGTTRKGVIEYSWLSLENGTYVPHQISYYEEKSNSQFELVSLFEVVTIEKTDLTTGKFREVLIQNCNIK